MSDSLIQVEGLSKKFCRSLKRSLWYGIKDLGSELRGHRHGGNGELRQDEFWAVRDMSFKLERGECLGLVGHNGAGKTTLLRMLNGLIKPDEGRIEMRGRVGALIALGAGFNPILTGRENIYVNASVLGLSKADVDGKINEIIDFAEIRDFIDSPVQNYSSGMTVRLGFSVAAILIEPDILFLDEVLAVGDISFVIKCLNVVHSLAQKSAVVFVSHNMQYISSFCTRIIVMEHGTALLDTPNVSEGIDRYYALIINEQMQVSGTGDAEISRLELIVDGETICDPQPTLKQGAELTIRLGVRVLGPRRGANIILSMRDEATSPILAVPLHLSEKELFLLPPGDHTVLIPVGKLDVNSGKYSFVVAVRDADNSVILVRAKNLSPFRVTAHIKHWGYFVRPSYPSIND